MRRCHADNIRACVGHRPLRLLSPRTNRNPHRRRRCVSSIPAASPSDAGGCSRCSSFFPCAATFGSSREARLTSKGAKLAVRAYLPVSAALASFAQLQMGDWTLEPAWREHTPARRPHTGRFLAALSSLAQLGEWRLEAAWRRPSTVRSKHRCRVAVAFRGGSRCLNPVTFQ